jgi:uncharacterized protein YrzB (UPF0473 family)
MDIRKIVINENNRLQEYDVLFTIKDEKDNKEFIIYTDVNSDIDIYAALYDEKDNKIEYINNPEDRKMIEEIMKIIKEKYKK